MNRSIKPYLFAMTSVVLWSHAFVSIKYCLRSVTPLELVILRHVPAALAFIIYLAMKSNLGVVPRLLRTHPVQVVLAALSAVAAYHFPLNWGGQYITAGAMSLIVGTGPIFTFLLASAFLREPPTWYKQVGIVLAFAGLYVCVRYAGGKAIGVEYWVGAAVVLIAPIIAGVNMTSVRYISSRHGAVSTTGSMIILGTLPTLFFVSPELVHKLPTLTWDFWAVLLFLGLGCTATAYLTWAAGLRTVEASRLSVFIYLVPTLGLIWGFVYLDEPITLWIILGAAMILTGVWITNRKEG